MASAAKRSTFKVRPALQSSDLIADPKNKKAAMTLCLTCFNKWDVNMPRHATHCPARDRNASVEDLKKLGAANKDAFNAACANMRGSIFFSMRELEDKPSYTPYEVAEILRSFGHNPVPERFDDLYERIPVFNTLTDRTFKKEVDEEEIRQDEEQILQHESLSEKDRRELITIPDIQIAGPSTEDEKETDSFGDLNDEPDLDDLPISGSLFQSRKGKRMVIGSDEEPTEIEANTVVTGKGKAPAKGPSKAKKSKIDQATRTLFQTTDDDSSDSDKDVQDDADTDVEVDEEGFVREYNWKSGPKRILQGMGWYMIPKTFWNEKVFDDFKAYYELRGKKKAIKENNIGNMKRLLYRMSNGARNYTYEIINDKNFHRVTQELAENKISFSTICNYYKSLKHFIRFEKKRHQRLMTDEGKRIATYLKYELEEIKDIGHSLMSKCANERKDKKLVKNRGPTPFECTEVLRSKAKHDVDALLAYAEKQLLNRDQVAKVNRYLVSIILLGLGNRPSCALGLTKELVEFALQNNRSINSAGQETVCINSRDHKTSEAFTARVVVAGDWLDFFERYAKYVRPALVKKTLTNSKAFFLQSDGRPFTKASEAPTCLQSEYNCQIINNGQARDSYETYVQKCGKDTTDSMAEFLCHSTVTRDKNYKVYSMEKSIEMFDLQQRMQQYYMIHDRQYLPDSFPALEDDVEGSQETESPPARRLKTKPKQTVIQTTDDDGQQPTTSSATARRKTPKKSSKSPLKGSHEIPMGRDSKAQAIVDWVVRKQGEFTFATVSETDIRKEFQFHDSKECREIVRKVRSLQNSARQDYLATFFLMRQAKAKKVQLKELTVGELQPATDHDLEKFKRSRGLTTGWGNINCKAISSLMIEKLNLAKSEDLEFTEQELQALIIDQTWENIYIRDTGDPEKGRGVFTGIHRIKKGTVVCDYHGDQVDKAEGERRLATYDFPECNYLLFFRANGNFDGQRCIDACVKCKCHTNDEFQKMKGRLINHTRGNHANLKPQARCISWRDDTGQIQQTVHVFLIAKYDIPPNTELLFDYGVRKDEAGNKMNWA